MKYSLFLLTALLLTSCIGKDHYNSYRQALEACNKWEKEGGEYKVIRQAKDTNGYLIDSYGFIVNRRSCEKEAETKQILGIEVNREEGQKIYIDVDIEDVYKQTIDTFRRKEKVIRNFYY